MYKRLTLSPATTIKRRSRQNECRSFFKIHAQLRVDGADIHTLTAQVRPEKVAPLLVLQNCFLGKLMAQCWMPSPLRWRWINAILSNQLRPSAAKANGMDCSAGHSNSSILNAHAMGRSTQRPIRREKRRPRCAASVPVFEV